MEKTGVIYAVSTKMAGLGTTYDIAFEDDCSVNVSLYNETKIKKISPFAVACMGMSSSQFHPPLFPPTKPSIGILHQVSLQFLINHLSAC